MRGNNYVILNGVSSFTVEGLLIQELPSIQKPKMRTRREEIDGRDGDIITNLGYEAYDREMLIGLHGNFNIDDVSAFFNTSGEAVFSNEPDKLYYYTIVDEIDYERLGRFREGKVKFHCQPYKYPNALVPIEDEVENITDTTPYLYRISADGQNIGSQEFDEIVGGTVAWNQILQNPNFADGINHWGGNNGTISVANNVLTLTTTTAGSGVAVYQLVAEIPQNHVVLFMAKFKRNQTGSGSSRWGMRYNNGTMYYYKSIAYDGTDTQELNGISKLTESANRCYLYPKTNTAVDDTQEVYYLNLIDLTQMFGTTIADYILSLETANTGDGVAYFKSLFPNDYYAYDSGTLMSVQTSEHKMVGKNLISVSSLVCGGSEPRTVITVFNTPLPKGTYTISCINNSNCNISIGFYDATSGGNSTGSVTFSQEHTERPVTLTGKTLRLYAYISQTNYDNGKVGDLSNIQMELGSATPYEPYTVHSYPLDSSLTLRGIPKLVDNKLSYDGDIYQSDGTVTRRYEQRAYQSGDESLVDAITDGTNTVIKLAEPTTETTIPYTNPQIVAKGGTEGYIDARGVAIPVGHNTRYPSDVDITVNNVGNVPSKPIITIYGNGIVNLYINGNQMLQVNIDEDYITLDFEELNAYTGGVYKNRQVVGNMSAFMLPVGTSQLSMDGDITSVQISKYIRYI